MTITTQFTLLILLAAIPAFIAHKKGRSFVTWYVYGLLLFVVALIHSLCISPNEEAKRKQMEEDGYVPCPYCKEPVRKDALVCPHCRRSLEEPSDTPEKGENKA